MTLEDFEATLKDREPPTSLAPLLRALWYDRRGDWDRAHQIAQDVDTPAGAMIHSYLHRKEGDLSNARYWYRRSGRPEAADSIDSEWSRLVTSLLD